MAAPSDSVLLPKTLNSGRGGGGVDAIAEYEIGRMQVLETKQSEVRGIGSSE